MSKFLTIKKVFFIGLVLIGASSFFSFAVPPAHAQTANTPLFLITWKAAGSYVPSFYQGKALPSYGTKVTASVELILNGRVLNISGQTIYWYLDGVLLGGGVGVQQMTFSPFGTPPNTTNLSVELPQYNGQYIAHAVEVPFVDPIAVIYAPYPNNTFSTNPVTVNALPYFFETSAATNLNFTWSVDGQAGSNQENPQEAEVTLPQGTPSGTGVDVSLSIKNPVGSTVATADQNLTYQSQL